MKKRRFFALFLILGLLVSLLSVPASAFEEIDVDARAALRAKYPTCECNVVLLQIGCTIAVHTGPYALGMGIMRRWKKQ